MAKSDAKKFTHKDKETARLSALIGKTVREVIYDDVNAHNQPFEGQYTLVFTDGSNASFSSSGDDHTHTYANVELPQREDGSNLKVGGHLYTRTRDGVDQIYIVGETKVSWILHPNKDAQPNHWGTIKRAKKDIREGSDYSFKVTSKEVLDQAWTYDNAGRISNWINSRMDADKLRQIAFILGYKEPEVKS